MDKHYYLNVYKAFKPMRIEIAGDRGTDRATIESREEADAFLKDFKDAADATWPKKT